MTISKTDVGGDSGGCGGSDRWIYFLIFGLVLLAYGPALQGGLLWDDPAHLTSDGLRSLDGLRRIWTEIGATQQYYPLLHSAFWLEHRLWGDATPGYHLVNALLHATSACLLVLILRRLLVPGAALAGAVFALHPVNAESVAWISEQKNALSLVFYLLSALTYLRFDDERRGRDYRLALGFYILAMLAKTVTATLPAALLVVLWWKRGSLSWRGNVRPLVPWLVLGLCLGSFSAWMEHSVIGAEGAAYDLTPVQRVLLAGHVVWFYLGKVVWPAHLMFIYPRWDVSAAPVAWGLFLAAALAVTAALWAVRARNRAPLAAWLFFVGSLFPALGFFNVYPFQYSYVADHFQYIAEIGIIVLGSAASALAFGRLPPAPRLAAAAIVVAGLGAMTAAQARHYRDRESLWRATWEENPNSWIVCNDLGQAILDQGRAAESIVFFEQALRQKPGDPDSENNLGVALAEAGRYDDAIAHYRSAIASNPGHSDAHMNLGATLAKLGQPAEAIASYQKALAAGGNTPSLFYDLGEALRALGRSADALRWFDEALRQRPAYADALNLKGLCLFDLGSFPEAVAAYEKGLQIAPRDFDLLNNLGVALMKMNRYDDAIVRFQQALAVQSDGLEIHENLGIALARAGRLRESATYLQEAVKRRPNDAELRNKLAIVLQQAAQP